MRSFGFKLGSDAKGISIVFSKFVRVKHVGFTLGLATNNVMLFMGQADHKEEIMV